MSADGRAVPSAFDPACVAEIDRRLSAVEAEHGVRVPLAVESGSRAWGFPSPDSDYDCRFLYVRPAPDYVSLWPARDVIETPLDRLIDVNGWDVAKALRLLVDKGNAVVLEWLASPIRYRDDPALRAELSDFAAEHVDRERVRGHYYHLARLQRAKHVRSDGDIAAKKLFYVLPPALCLRWMRLRPAGLPPMHMAALMEESAVEPVMTSLIREMIELKARWREAGTMPFRAELAAFIDLELAAAAGVGEGAGSPRAEARRTADALLARLAATSPAAS